ncbi:hypothetical protein PsorP6_006936 [Peronosclerospora sorghi]|uniref:Uncharacterized protein n=1 Tax=Peronosclerospora sorghi TaxID=230839 RepID=A0ACC0WBL8_9STRA|nr:hypothetical protein PsorP6_006936 [Peronosclerospora sorghi]
MQRYAHEASSVLYVGHVRAPGRRESHARDRRDDSGRVRTISYEQALEAALETDPTSVRARLYERDVPLLDVSSVLLWALGVMMAVGAAYASVDRRKPTVSMAVEPENERHGKETRDEREKQVWELDARHAVSFILLTGVALSVFYFHDPNTLLQSGGHRNIFSFSRRQSQCALLFRTPFYKVSIIEDGKSCGRFALSFNRKRCIAIDNQTIVLGTITNHQAMFFC